MRHGVCPWWVGYLLITPLRRWLSNPATMLQPFVRSGMTVFEPGPGMGFFTIHLARLVGPDGRVVASDLQPKMLAGLRRRATRAGLTDRLDLRLASPDSLAIGDLTARVDFVLAFAMVHEVPDQKRFFAEILGALRPGGTVLLAEPRGHVSRSAFEDTVRTAGAAGFETRKGPPIRRSHSAILTKRPAV